MVYCNVPQIETDEVEIEFVYPLKSKRHFSKCLCSTSERCLILRINFFLKRRNNES